MNHYLPDEEWTTLRDNIVAGGITPEQSTDEIAVQFAVDLADEYLCGLNIMPESMREELEGIAA